MPTGPAAAKQHVSLHCVQHAAPPATIPPYPSFQRAPPLSWLAPENPIPSRLRAASSSSNGKMLGVPVCTVSPTVAAGNANHLALCMPAYQHDSCMLRTAAAPPAVWCCSCDMHKASAVRLLFAPLSVSGVSRQCVLSCAPSCHAHQELIVCPANGC